MKKLLFTKKEKLLSEKYEGLRFSLYTASFIILIILLVEVVLLLYWSMLTFYVETEVTTNSVSFIAAPMSPQRLKNDYLSQIKVIASDTSQVNLDTAGYQGLKDKLLLLSVPREYLDWHFRLVVAVDKMLDYMTLQVNSPSREHEQSISNQASYINDYLTTIDHVSSAVNE